MFYLEIYLTLFKLMTDTEKSEKMLSKETKGLIINYKTVRMLVSKTNYISNGICFVEVKIRQV